MITFSIDRDKKMVYEMKGTLKGDHVAGVAAAMGTTVEWQLQRAK